jgi:tetratricopeptide (TPR) repeat protein
MTQPAKKSRRLLLEEFLAAHPQDAFARYGLAMECANLDDAAAAVENFEKLLAENPNYVAGYFQYGQLLAKLSRTADARRTLSNGIEAARRAGDQHAGSEMEAALAQLPAS